MNSLERKATNMDDGINRREVYFTANANIFFKLSLSKLGFNFENAGKRTVIIGRAIKLINAEKLIEALKLPISMLEAK